MFNIRVLGTTFIIFILTTDGARPPEPEIVSTEVLSPTEISVRWHDPELGEKQRLRDKRHYTVKYHVHQHRQERFQLSKVKDTKAVVPDLRPNTTYVFRIKVIKGQRSSGWSKTAVNRTLPLETFIQVEISTLTSSSIKLSWTLPRQQSEDSDMYTIFWSEENGEVQVTKVKAVARSHVFENLVPGRSYSFRMISPRSSLGVVSSATVTTSTYSDKPSKAPRDVKLQLIGPKLVRVRWRPPTVRKSHGKIIQYKIQYKRKGSRRGDLCTVMTSQNNREFNLTDVEPDSIYRVRISARTINGTGPYSKWESVVIPEGERRNRKSKMSANEDIRNRSPKPSADNAEEDPLKLLPEVPGKLRVTGVTSTVVKLEWSAPVTPECCPPLMYSLLLANKTESGGEPRIITEKDTETVIDELTPGREYAVSVCAFNAHGRGIYSNPVYFTTKHKVTPVLEARDGQFLVGGRANLTCVMEGDPLPHLAWYREGRTIEFYQEENNNLLVHKQDNVGVVMTTSNSGSRKVASLIIDPVKHKDEGNYTCSAINYPHRLVNKTVQLIINEKNERTADVSSTVLPSQDKTSEMLPAVPLNLHVTHVASTSVRIEWSAPAVADCCPIVAYVLDLVDKSNNRLLRSIITGPKTENFVDGLIPGNEYAVSISAFNVRGASGNSSLVYFTTLSAVTPVVEATGGVFLAGSRANLTCVVVGDPLPKIDWYREGMMAPYYKTQSLNLLVHTQAEISVIKETHTSGPRKVASLIIDYVSPGHDGNYICSTNDVTNNWSLNKSVSLTVHVQPTFLSVDKSHAISGTSTALSCVVTGIPLPEVTWSRFKDGVVFPEEKDSNARIYVTVSVDERKNIVNKTLHFSSLEQGDEGNYTCQTKRGDYSTWRVVPLTLEVPLPPPVSEIRAIAVSPSSISVLWERPVDYKFPITAYNLVYKNQATRSTIAINTTTRHVEIGDLHPDSLYKVKVRAYNTHGVGNVSPEIAVKTLPDVDLQPLNVSAVALNSSIIQLDWKAPTSIDPKYIQGFNIYYKKSSSPKEDTLFIAGNTNKRFLIGLNKEGTFYLRISTVLTWGDEATSQWIQIKKPKPVSIPPPRRLSATTTSDAIMLSWRQSSSSRRGSEGRVIGYNIRYRPISELTKVITQAISGRVTSFTLKNLVPEMAYQVTLSAITRAGESIPTTIIAKTKGLRPGSVVAAQASPISSTEILVQWREPKRGPVTRYHVRYWRPGKRDKQSAWMYAPNTQYIAGSLRKFSQYRFEIIPYNKDQIGEIIVIYASTMDDVPETPPKNVKLAAINASTLLATWEPPSKSSQNGIITGYKLVLKKKAGKRLASFSVEGGRRNYTFKNLEPSRVYKVRVAAMTVRGTGPSSKWTVQMTKKIELRAPESPSTIETNASTTVIVVTWTKPRDIGVPVLGYIVGFGRYIPEVYRYVLGSKDLSLTLDKLEPDTSYFISVRSYNNFGESLPKFKVVRTEKEPATESPLRVALLIRAIAVSTTAINITWASWNAELGKRLNSNVHFRIRFSALDESEYRYKETNSIPTVISNLRVGTNYEFSAKALTGQYETEWSLPVLNATLQTEPSPPENLSVTSDPDKHTTLTLTWQLKDDNIEEVRVYSSTDPDLEMTLWKTNTFQGPRVIMRVHEVTPHTIHYFWVQAKNKAGYGPLSKEIIYSPPIEPEAAPSTVRVYRLDDDRPTTIEVTWSPPEKPSGTITSYNIYYTPKSNITDSDWLLEREPSLSCLLIGLEFNATYRIKVRARYSGGGLSPPSPVVVYGTSITYPSGPGRTDQATTTRSTSAETSTSSTFQGADTSTTAVQEYATSQPSVSTDYTSDVTGRKSSQGTVTSQSTLQTTLTSEEVTQVRDMSTTDSTDRSSVSGSTDDTTIGGSISSSSSMSGTEQPDKTTSVNNPVNL